MKEKHIGHEEGWNNSWEKKHEGYIWKYPTGKKGGDMSVSETESI